MRRPLLAALLIALAGPASAAEQPLKVVASISILADMAKNIAGDRADITALVGPDSDPHVFSPTPEVAARVAEADVVIVNGLALEGWMDRLLESSGFDGTLVVASSNIKPRVLEDDDDDDEAEHHHGEAGEEHAHEAEHHDGEAEEDHAAEHGEHHHHHGGLDPHAWQSLANGHLYVDAIADGLIAADPVDADYYRANRDAYDAQIDALDAEVKAKFADMPAASRTIITNHDAFGYFGDAYGLTFVAPVGFSTEAEPSAKDVAALIRQIRTGGISAVFFESGADRRLVERIAAETSATVGGTLYAGSLSGPSGPAPTYLDMMRYNARTIAAAIHSDS